MNSISVFCGSSDGNDKEIITTAYALGKEFAQKNIHQIYLEEIKTGFLNMQGIQALLPVKYELE